MNKEYGQYLKEERERKGLTLEQVSKETKVSVKILHGLESMERDILPSETYYVGMLKLYAKHLGIDQSKILGMLKISEIQEQPVEFDLINLQTEKKKRKRFILLIVGIVIGGLIIGFSSQKIAKMWLEGRAQKKVLASNNQEFEKIDGFYEANFNLNDKYLLVNKDLSALLEVTSVDPPIVLVGNTELKPQLNRPQLVDLNSDNTPEYVLYMRQINVSKKQLLLRFDPSIDNAADSLIENLDNSLIYFQEETDGEEILISSEVSKSPIQLDMNFVEASYYRIITNDNEVLEEAAVAKGERKTFTSNDSFILLLSNSSFVNLVVNSKDVSIPKTGLPSAYSIGWKNTQDGKINLVLIPIP